MQDVDIRLFFLTIFYFFLYSSLLFICRDYTFCFLLPPFSSSV